VSHARQAELEAKGVVVEVDHRRRMKSALAAGHHKADIWWRLHVRDGLTKEQLGAVRDLQDLMARRAGVGGRDEAKAYDDVRADEPFRDPCLVTDRMLEAAREMDLTLALVGPPSSRLLAAILWPAALCEDYDPREIVARVTGETQANAQNAVLRTAAQALVDVRPEVQRRLKGAKAANQSRRDPQGFGEERAEVRTHPFHSAPGR
jgi:hypothetical protein